MEIVAVKKQGSGNERYLPFCKEFRTLYIEGRAVVDRVV